MSDKIKHEWYRYHKTNPEVWNLFQEYTLQVIARGYQHYSSKTIIERIRWHHEVETKGEIFKINNNYTAYYARLFMANHPEHEGFFRTRQLAHTNNDIEYEAL
jgi:hypothetical protein